MASIVLVDVRLSLVSDPSDEVILSADLNMDVQVSEQDAIVETEEITASGAIRSITEPGNPRRMSVDSGWTDRTTVERLRARKGLLQCYRDWDGRLIFGTFASLTVEPQGGAVSHVSLSFNQRTHSVEV